LAEKHPPERDAVSPACRAPKTPEHQTRPLVGGALRLGPCTISPPVLLAPMAGYTNWAFRQLVRGLGGVGLVTTEMVCARGLVEQTRRGGRLPEQLWGVAEEPRPVAVQLWGGEVGVLAEAAGWVAEHLKPSVIDLNFGCPAPTIRVRAGGGAALLAEPGLIGRIVEAVVQAAAPVPVSGKIRLGVSSRQINALEVARTIKQAGASGITIHGRTADQMFRGRADWQAIARIKQEVKDLPVIGNGDVRSAADLLAAFAQHRVDGVMIGRAALGRPWIFRQAAALLAGQHAENEPPTSQQGRVLLEHFRLACEQFGPQRATVVMRRHACCYGQGLRGARGFRTRISRAAGPEEFVTVVREFFER